MLRRSGAILLLLASLWAPGAWGTLAPAAAQVHTPAPADALPAAHAGDSILVLSWVQERILDYVLPPYRGARDRARLVEEGRPQAIAALDVGGAALPGDDWITGHRVGMRVKTGELDLALELARDCQASEWWCAALLGFVLHERGEIEASERAYDLALSRMPEDLRCEWISEIHLFERHLYGWTRAGECEAFSELSSTVWWLSNPLFMEPGNDRRTEHLSRIVQLRFHNETLELHGPACHPGHHWSLISHGFPPTRWSYAAPFEPFDGPGLRFVPGREVRGDPFASREEDWETAPAWPEERYAVPRWSVLHPLPAQVALFQRNGVLHVAAASELRGHPLEGGAGLRTAVALSEGPDTPPTVLPFLRPGSPRLFRTDLAPVPLVISMEAVTDEGAAGRTRWGHRPGAAAPGGLALSDPLLFAWEDGMEETLESVVPRMLGSTTVGAEGELGVFWEVYGVARGHDVDLSVAVVPEDRGIFRRLGEALRVLPRNASMEFTWREAPGEEAIAGRALRLDLSKLSPGRYTFRVSALGTGGTEVIATRSMEIVAGSP